MVFRGLISFSSTDNPRLDDLSGLDWKFTRSELRGHGFRASARQIKTIFKRAAATIPFPLLTHASLSWDLFYRSLGNSTRGQETATEGSKKPGSPLPSHSLCYLLPFSRLLKRNVRAEVGSVKLEQRGLS